MRRSIKIGLIALGIGSAVTLGFFVDVVGRIQSLVNERETEENPFKPPTVPLYAPTDPPLAVKMFFPSTAGEPLLGAEDETIFKSSELQNQAKQVLQKLLDGPANDALMPSFSPDTKINEVFISEDGTAYIDFSNSVAASFQGGMLNEQAAIYSVVNSLTYNLPEIKQVRILIGGAEKETLAGHCLLLLPLELDLNLTDTLPQEEEPHAQ